MVEEQFDLIVIGGGPAGSTLSTLVAKEGFKVLLLEREKFPRYQIGESLVPATAHGLSSWLGLREEMQAKGYPEKYGACFNWGRNSATSTEMWCFNFRTLPFLAQANAASAYQVKRADFDDMLLKNAQRHGVEVREEHTVTEFFTENGRITGLAFTDANGKVGRAKARFVGDASGHASKLASIVGERVHSKFFQNVALFAYYEDGFRLPPPRSGNFLGECIKEGWLWYIPLDEKLTSVGAVIAKKDAGRMSDPEDAMNHYIKSCRIISQWLSKAKRVTDGMYGQYRIRKDFSYANTRFWRRGGFLVGDAACFLDPLFSTGVHLATYSAMLAARSVNSVLKGGIDEEVSFAEYEARYRVEYERIHDFLVAFYGVEENSPTSLWRERLIAPSERENDAFSLLVTGMTSKQYFESNRAKNWKILSDYVDADRPKSLLEVGKAIDVGERVRSAMEAMTEGRPIREGGLVPAQDGMWWRTPGPTFVPEGPIESLRWAWIAVPDEKKKEEREVK